MAFKGRDPVRTEIVMDNRIIEQVKLFNCLGNVISYGKELDIDNKFRNYLKIKGILNNVFRPQKTAQENNNKIIQCSFVMWQRNWTVTARGGKLNCYSKGRQTGLLQQGAAEE